MKEVLKNKAAFDPFDETTNKTQETRALDSYLWELHVLLHHYDPNVVNMMKMLRSKLLRTRQQFNRIVSITYETEFNRLLKAGENNFAFAPRSVGYMSEESVIKKLFI